MLCFACGEDSRIEFDSAAGNSVCTRCGTVLEENAIVAEVTFGETSSGAAMVQGSFVGADQTRAKIPGYRKGGMGSQESREQTMLNGRKRIQALSTALRLPERIADAGQRYFNLAVNMNFTQGRRAQYVVAACLYSACRMEKTSHMLIDFSDLLEINVFVLGATYLKLIKELTLQLPTVDPSIYISRFASLLEFGDETQKVAQDAVRLVARMGRDWMHIGRRPAGICGACLLLAARMNNFRRTIAEIVQVVKIADVTLRKRLAEFKDTPSGALSVADFRTIWLDETADPPAFARNQKKEEEARKEKEKRDQEREENGSDTEVFNEMANIRSSPILESSMSEKAKGKRKLIEDDEDEGADKDSNLADQVNAAAEALANEPQLDEAIISEMGITLESDTGKLLTEELDKVHQRRMELAAAEPADDLIDLDEDELDMFILTPEEVEAKSRLWMENNKEYLQALADKQTGPDGELKPETKPKRKRQKKGESAQQANNAAESAKQMLAKKKFSKKINYAAVDSLFGTEETSIIEQKAPLLVPMPTFGNSRLSTPFSVQPTHIEELVEVEETEVDPNSISLDAPELEPEIELEEEVEEWQKLTARTEEEFGYDEAY